MKLLVVEDEHKIAQSIKKGMEQESMVVDVAYDGEEGYDQAVSGDYDAIILDMMLPSMDGMTFCANLRKERIHTPILILTAKGQLTDKINGLDAGADDYLTKPFAFEELLARVRAITRRPHGYEDSLLLVADLSMNTTTYEVKRSGKTIKLSSREYSLLEYLLRHPNQIVTKDQIMYGITMPMYYPIPLRCILAICGIKSTNHLQAPSH
jgi:DNA-binding response OmpR family regulator